MSSENSNVIKNILPSLHSLGWKREDMEFEYPCSKGRVDILYRVNGKNLIVLEAKKEKLGQKTALNQAINYAKAIKVPIAVATDGSTYFHTYHLQAKSSLKGYQGEEIDLNNYKKFLKYSNLKFFKKNNSLKTKIKSVEDLRKIFNVLNSYGKDIGLTSGVERVLEIAKILFLKMLSDNNVGIEIDDWDYIVSVPIDRKIKEINHQLENIKSIINIGNLEISKSKNNIVDKIINKLDEVNLNHKNYDITGSLFENFLSERARGGGTNDLGQYFTPKRIIDLIYILSGYNYEKTIYDPFCGTGGILLSFFINNTYNIGSEDKSKFGKNYLFGSEITPAISFLAKMNMVLAGDGHSNIENIDSLSKTNRYIKDNTKFDIVATNIPFDPATPEDTPAEYFKISNTSTDIANYIEHCLIRCKPRGKVLVIVGKGFLTEKKSKSFRKSLIEKYTLENVFMLYEGLFSPYTEIFSCLLVISKKPSNKNYVDFFSIKNKEDINIVKKYYNTEEKYSKGFYKVDKYKLLENNNCDLRGKIYQNINTNILKLKDIVTYLDNTKITNIRENRKKLTTPNAIDEGIYLIETKSNKQVEEGYGSFVYELKGGAIVVSRITNKRKNDGRYIGSAMVGNNGGHLITIEYHQILPNNPEDLYFILYYLRTSKFQEIVELASGTGGQQRVEAEILLNQVIDKPTKKNREFAKKYLLDIENSINAINKEKENISKIKNLIYNSIL